MDTYSSFRASNNSADDHISYGETSQNTSVECVDDSFTTPQGDDINQSSRSSETPAANESQKTREDSTAYQAPQTSQTSQTYQSSQKISQASPQEHSWNVRNMAIIAMLCALSLALSYIAIPIMPAAPYLHYDPSGVVAIIAGLTMGIHAAITVSILGFIYHLFINPLGAGLAILITLVLSVTTALIAHKKPTAWRLSVALFVGSLLALIVAILGNLVITPIYAHVSLQTVLHMIIPILLPFNLIKFALHAAISAFIYRSALMIMTKRQHHA